MADNPGNVVTRFQSSSLFKKAWFLSIQPHTIASGFQKVGISPLSSSHMIIPTEIPVMQQHKHSSDPQGEKQTVHLFHLVRNKLKKV